MNDLTRSGIRKWCGISPTCEVTDDRLAAELKLNIATDTPATNAICHGLTDDENEAVTKWYIDNVIGWD